MGTKRIDLSISIEPVPTLLSINNYFYLRGGSEVVFLEQNKLFEKKDWIVVPFSMTHPNNIDSIWSKYFVDEIEYGNHYSACEKIVRFSKVIFSFEARKKLNRLLNFIRADICHCHNIYHHISPSILSLLSKRKIPIVLTLHDLKICCPACHMFNHKGICERCKSGKLYEMLIHRCIKKSSTLSSVILIESMLHTVLRSYRDNVDRFISPSKFYKKKITEWGWDSDRCVYIPNFVNTDEFQPNYNPGSAFIYFGRLSPEKGLTTLIKAAAKTKATVTIVGDGPQMPVLRDLVEKLRANVTFLGHLSGKDLHDVVKTARATIIPSEWYENAPMCILESYALGKPVIGAAIGGIPELIRERETGITFESGSVDSLSVCLEQISKMKNSKLSQMGRLGRSWIEAEFSAKQYYQRVSSLYQEIGVSLT